MQPALVRVRRAFDHALEPGAQLRPVGGLTPDELVQPAVGEHVDERIGVVRHEGGEGQPRGRDPEVVGQWPSHEIRCAGPTG